MSAFPKYFSDGEKEEWCNPIDFSYSFWHRHLTIESVYFRPVGTEYASQYCWEDVLALLNGGEL